MTAAGQPPTVYASGGHPNLRPRDAATLVLVERNAEGPRVLMGRRAMRHVFMPGAFVFPGGRVDPADGQMIAADGYPEPVLAKLLLDMKGKPSERRARALGLAAIRETYEETGIAVGRRGEPFAAPDGWSGFATRGVLPRLSDLRLIGRAITPPGKIRRFDTRFFVAFAEAIADRAPELVSPSAELEELRWMSFADTDAIELPGVTRAMLRHLRERLTTDPELDPSGPVLYFRMLNGKRRSDLI